MDALNQAVCTLFTEVFEGTPPGAEGTYFVQGGEAMWATLDDLTAAEASTRVFPGASTVAAHTIHTSYYLDLTLRWIAGERPEGDWPGSWAKQEVTDEEWAGVKEEFRRKVAAFVSHVASATPDEGDLLGMLANLGHVAYHLGAVRQLYLAVASGR
ncbi:MAG: DinB family protein [Fimbriimonadaceae bacterium]|nr:DinB family protein [Fimbriimonadaceae bacterium]